MNGLIDRRRFLATSTASVSLSLLAPQIAAAAGRRRFSFDTLIVDHRIAGREALAAVAESADIPFISIRGDLPRLWFDSLRKALVERPTTIAGMTSDLDCEVMRAFARDAGYGQQQRIDITLDAATGHRSISCQSRSYGVTASTAQTSQLERLVDDYVNASMSPHERSGPAQLAAWIIAPIRG